LTLIAVKFEEVQKSKLKTSFKDTTW